MTNFTIVICFIFSIFLNISNAAPKISFENLMIHAELNPQNVIEARLIAVRDQLPINVVTTDNLMIDVKYIENGRPVYAVFTNFANPYDGGYSAFYEDVVSKINFANAKIDYGNGNIVDNTGGYFNPVLSNNRLGISRFLMIPDWTTDRVYLFSLDNGDLVDTAFIPTTNPQLQSPKHALQHFTGKQILVSDQISDVVQRFDTNGTYLGVFAPAGGPNTAILDNIRGIRYRANNNLLVNVGGGTSNNTIQQFDTAGNHIGRFITGNLNSPFDILIRPNDILISNSTGPNDITRFDLKGNFLSVFHASANLTFPQQMYRHENGNVLVAGFSSPSGIVILDSSGTYIRTLTGVTGNRGIYLLGNGHYLTTNGTGVHEIDSSTGGLIRTVTTGNFQYISLYNTEVLNLTLTIDLEACNIQDTISVELRSATTPYNLIETKTGIGGQSLSNLFYFQIAANGTPYYIVVKHRNSIATWSGSTVSFTNDTLSYDFTSAASQAFGNNMVNVGGEWSFYTGDVNQDGIVDGGDLGLIDNDSFNFVTGYVATDLNCDGIVDGADAAFADNNASNFVGVIAP